MKFMRVTILAMTLTAIVGSSLIAAPKKGGNRGGTKIKVEKAVKPEYLNPNESPKVQEWVGKYNSAKEAMGGLKDTMMSAEKNYRTIMNGARETRISAQGDSERMADLRRQLTQAEERYNRSRVRVLGNLHASDKSYVAAKEKYAYVSARLDKLKKLSKHIEPAVIAKQSVYVTELQRGVTSREDAALKKDDKAKTAKARLDEIQLEIGNEKKLLADNLEESGDRDVIREAAAGYREAKVAYYNKLEYMKEAKREAERAYGAIVAENNRREAKYQKDLSRQRVQEALAKQAERNRNSRNNNNRRR